MNWKERIVADPGVLAGKQVVKGTRLSVEFVLGLLEAGWNEAQILQEHPRLSTDDIRACLACAKESLEHERVYTRA